MAQHDFAPAWLSFPTPPSSSKPTLTTEKHSEGLVRLDSRHNVIRRRQNSSDAFDAAHGRSSGGNLGRKEKAVWRSQGRNGSENINQGGTQNGTGTRSRSSTVHGGKSPGHREGSVSENDAMRKDDPDRRKQFEAEDFPSLNPEHEKEFNQNKSVAAGVWEYPLNSRSRPSRMLVIKKGMKDDFSLSGYPIATSSRSSDVKNEGDAPKSQAPKENSPTQEQRCLEVDEHEQQNLDSSNEIFRPNQCAHPDSLDMSQTSVEEDVDDCSLQNRGGTLLQRDINLNFDKGEIPQGNGNPFTSRQITRSSTFPQENVLSSSLEEEHRLLKEMGWQEDIENDETYAPLTEDEMREFQAISEQLQKNGLRKNGLLRNGLSLAFRFDPWKRSTFSTTYVDDDTETSSSSSDTSDDGDYL
ncbi:vasculin [Bufo gargarizans]|uniref:vasculin n=1 Tax=Bufo gargarizans TaxID=30331 RepID=UPI001CF15B4D|nr:vasculin [Bufo gargarizans]XP_044132632.1 vasculin [Bufo gargarizans]XP_044132633.1 vasculin [Bufo gargarizans]